MNLCELQLHVKVRHHLYSAVTKCHIFLYLLTMRLLRDFNFWLVKNWQATALSQYTWINYASMDCTVAVLFHYYKKKTMFISDHQEKDLSSDLVVLTVPTLMNQYPQPDGLTVSV